MKAAILNICAILLCSAASFSSGYYHGLDNGTTRGFTAGFEGGKRNEMQDMYDMFRDNLDPSLHTSVTLYNSDGSRKANYACRFEPGTW